MSTHPLRRSLALGALTLTLVLGAACGSDEPATKVQTGVVEDSTTTTAPAVPTTSAPATTTTQKATTITTAAPLTATTTARATTTTTEPQVGPYYANCDAVRATGVAPISEGQPGYRSGLDRDGDGIACDK